MGIFSEDLLNLGNLIDVEFEIKVPAPLLSSTVKGLSFELAEGLMRVGFKKKGLIFSKDVQVLFREDPKAVRNTSNERSIGLLVATDKNLKEVLEKGGFSQEGDHVFINLFEAIKNTEEYLKVPKQFRERIILSRYKLKDGFVQLWAKVSKGV
ncbi:hypothetical protein [Thermocrinis sp.]|uniref:hypothetical protein n=1 Tax=Thermocrinis sp. TaxID=2024383 RepID=UPI002FDDE715